MIKFIRAAFSAGVAYIDCDGCILKKFPVPDYIQQGIWRLLWWRQNLQPTPVIWHRLPLLYFLRLFGVRLVLWTNRGMQHRSVTTASLGKHIRLFDEMRFRDGCKILDRLDGPVMDDDAAYFSCAPSSHNCLLVESL